MGEEKASVDVTRNSPHATHDSDDQLCGSVMDDAIARIVQAIAVASNPLEQDKALQVEAVNYLGQVQQNAHRDEVWSLALALFVGTDDANGKRKYDVQTRLFALRILDEFLDNK